MTYNSFPSTNKFFAFKYGILWYATANDKPVPLKDKKYLRFDRRIKNFEFSSAKGSAFVQVNDELNIYVGLEDCFQIKKVKCAHFSSRCNHHLFVLGADKVLRLVDLKTRTYDSTFAIKNVDNFAIFPKFGRNIHYLAIIRKPYLFYIDSILFEGKSISEFLNNEPVDDLLNNGIIQEKFEIGDNDCDIIVGETDVFIGSQEGSIYVVEKSTIETDNNIFIKKFIGKVDRFIGFIENNGIFALSSAEAYIVDKSGLIELFKHSYIACVSLSPQVIACESETCYVKASKITSYGSQDEVPKEQYTDENEELEQYLNDSFFIRVNFIQIRGEKLLERQKEFDYKFGKLIIQKNNEDKNKERIKRLDEIKVKYEELRKRLNSQITPYNSIEINQLSTVAKQLETDFKNMKK